MTMHRLFRFAHELTVFAGTGPRRPYPALHWGIVAIHALFGLAVYHRPFLPLITPSYGAFDNIIPWLWWGNIALWTAFWLTISRPASVLALTAHFISFLWFLLVAYVFALGGGITTAFTTYSTLACLSLVLFGTEFGIWFAQLGWVQRLAHHPPRWAQRLAPRAQDPDA